MVAASPVVPLQRAPLDASERLKIRHAHQVARPRKVLLLSYAYSPSIGGIETVGRLVATGLKGRGYDVRVVSATPGPAIDESGIRVLRLPSPRRLLRALAWSDTVLQSNVSLKLAWPLVFRLVRRPWVVVNHTPIGPPGKSPRLRDRLKQATLPRGATYAVSDYLRREIPRTAATIPNPFDATAFTAVSAPQHRRSDLLFVGRLARAKGLDVLIDALADLRHRGSSVRLTVVGDGPERATLEARARVQGVDDLIEFRGAASPVHVGSAMRAHTILVIPSRPIPPEAFGIVALEGLASGCVVVGTDRGGLPEAVGEAGLLVPPDDHAALAAALTRVISDSALRERLLAASSDQLRRFETSAVLDQYEAALARAHDTVRSRAIRRGSVS